jgi:hypothetical protein
LSILNKKETKMVEIMYGDHYKQAELAGKSVAEARGQYQDELGIPSKAQAKLNDNWVKTKLEAETELSDDDQLCFEVKKGRKIPLLAGALLLALAISGGVFAYAFTTAIPGITMPATGDPWATISTPALVVNQTVHPGEAGIVTTGILATITPAANWTGDYEVIVYLTNAPALVRNYRYFHMEITVGAVAQWLTLRNAEVAFIVTGVTGGVASNVTLSDGSFEARPRPFVGDTSPRLWIEIKQAGPDFP